MNKNIKNVIIIGIILFLFFFIYTCRKNTISCNLIKSDTIKKIEYIQQPKQIIKEYIPKYITITKILIKSDTQFIPSNNIDTLKQQYNFLVNNYTNKNVYTDSIKLKNSFGINVGTINIQDTITQNQITARNIQYTLKFPKETITINNTKTLNTRKVFFGMDGVYTKQHPITQLGGSLLYEDKQGNVFKMGTGIDFNQNKQFFSVGIYKKVKL